MASGSGEKPAEWRKLAICGGAPIVFFLACLPVILTHKERGRDCSIYRLSDWTSVGFRAEMESLLGRQRGRRKE